MKLAELLERFPIRNGESPEVFQREFKLGSLHAAMIGLSLPDDKRGEITASAVGPLDSALTRAFFELHERVALLEPNDSLPERAPLSAQPSWTYSLSNGAAAHLNFEKAAEAAHRELIERDRVLRSWWGEFKPSPTRLLASPTTIALSEFYDLESYDFGESVAGVFGVPTEGMRPLFLGFGCKGDLAASIDHAVHEGLQRIAFLWDEPASEGTKHDDEDGSLSVDSHLTAYLSLETSDILRNWLTCGHPKIRLKPHAPNVIPRFEDLTPPSLKGKLAVVRCLADDRMPLTFGRGHPWFADPKDPLARDFPLHPIA